MHLGNERGFSFVELVITVAVLLILVGMLTPSFLSYLKTAEIQASAREVQAILANARSEAIKQNCTVTATRSTGGFTFSRGTTCPGGAGAFTVTGMSSGGIFKTGSPVTIAGVTSVIFNQLGAAPTNGTFTLTSTKYSTTMQVIVQASGRTVIQQ